jgi:hypothetical protein
LNDDLWKNPFDDEFERFVLAVRDLLSPILEDVQRFGLKVRHLAKYRNRVERFYRQEIAGPASVRETTARYRKRFERYKESLFSFIEEDGVPWHNNVAERALRHLAIQRKISGAFSEKGVVQYLRLLGIAQTCRFSENHSSASSCRNLQTSTNTKNGAECIRTGLSTVGKQSNAHTWMNPSRRKGLATRGVRRV